MFFCLTFSYAQSPEKFTYQSIIKNSSGYLLKSQDVGLKISVLFNSSNGIAVYSEEHTVESNDNGLVTLIIGDGISSDVFSDIDWGAGEYFLKVEVDPEGGVNYVMEQTSQLLSVPYALYAGNSGSNLNLLGQDYINLTGQTLTINKVDLADDVDGVLPVVNGGTGSSTAPMVGVITAIDATASRLVLGLSTVANTGDYSDLSNTPTLPTDFISAASGGDFLGDITATNLSGTNTGDQTLPTDFISAASGGDFLGDITATNLSGTNTGDQTLPTDFISAASGGDFLGDITATNLSGTNTGDQTLPTDFISAASGGDFLGDITATNLSGTNTGDQTLPTDFISAASGGDFLGDITATNLSGTNTGDQTLPTDFISAASGGDFLGDITATNLSGTNTGDQTATEVTSSASGNIAAETVQAALAELDTEKLALAGGTMTGNIDMGDNDISNVSTFDSTGATSLATVDGVVNIASAGLATTIKGTLNVDEAVTFDTTLDVTGDTSVSTFDSTGATLLATGGGVVNIASAGLATTIKGTLNVDEAVTFDTTLDVTGDTSVSTFDSTGATLLATGGGVVNIASAGLATTIKGTLNVDEAVTFDTTLDVTGDTSVSTFDSTGATLLATGGGVVNIASAGLATTIKGTLNVDEAVTFDTTLDVTGDTSVSTFDSTGATLLATGGGVVNIASAGLATTIKGTLNVDEAVTFDTTLDVTGDTSVKGLKATGKVITASGTTGDRTINAIAGSVNFGSSDTSVRVINSFVDENSVIILTKGSQGTSGGTQERKLWVVPSSCGLF